MTIRDNGIGIGADTLPHIFDIFRQADNSLERTQGGLGIGLTLVKNLVEMHAGSIKAASDGLNKAQRIYVAASACRCAGSYRSTCAEGAGRK